MALPVNMQIIEFIDEMRKALGIPADVLDPHVRAYLEAKEKQDGHRRAAEEVHSDSDQASSPGAGGAMFSTPIQAIAAARAAQDAAERARLARIAAYSRYVPGRVTVVPFVPVPLLYVDEEPVIPDEGLKPGEVIGHRAWKVFYDTLLSFNGHTWDPQLPIVGKPEVRGEGVHAFKEEGQLINTPEYWNPLFGPFPVLAVGTIHMWGVVVEHERGYRSQFAAVRSIDQVFSINSANMPLATSMEVDDETRERLRKRYLP